MDTLFELDEPGAGPLLPLPPAPPRRRHAARRELPAGMRAAVLERDGWICQCCGILCSATKTAKRARWATVDHVIPVSRGGWDDPVNLQTLCLRCNEAKGDAIIDYRADVSLRLALDLEREDRDLIPDEERFTRGEPTRGTEKLSVVLTCRVTETEAAALRARYGSGTYAARAGVDRLLYAAS